MMTTVKRAQSFSSYPIPSHLLLTYMTAILSKRPGFVKTEFRQMCVPLLCSAVENLLQDHNIIREKWCMYPNYFMFKITWCDLWPISERIHSSVVPDQQHKPYWLLVRNANSWALPQFLNQKLCLWALWSVLTYLLCDSDLCQSWRTTPGDFKYPVYTYFCFLSIEN